MDPLFRTPRKPWSQRLPLLVGAGFALLIVLLTTATGPAQPVDGEVTRFTVGGRKGGAPRVMLVRVDGRDIRVKGPITLRCEEGDRVRMMRRSHLWGTGYQISDEAYPCKA